MILILDLLIISSCLYFTTKALFGKHLLHSIIYFMYFGIVSSFVWLRLNAPDVALAEIAIGTALTGALFFSVAQHMPQNNPEKLSIQTLAPQLLPVITATLIGLLAFLTIQKTPDTLSDLVTASMSESGVLNPVTAVLLNFRAYDTFLEITVLITAAIGTLSFIPLRRQKNQLTAFNSNTKIMPVIVLFRTILIPLLILFAGYSLWIGYKAPGGAFQSGAMLAGLVIISTWIKPAIIEKMLSKINWPLIIGAIIFGGIGMVLEILSGTAFLTYPADYAKYIILVIELFSTLSIATALSVIYFGLIQGTEEETPHE